MAGFGVIGENINQMLEKASLYIHIPFCRSKCVYCDFASFAGIERLMEPYTAALEREMDAAPRLAAPTVYIGGGTPSYLSAQLMERVLRGIAGHFSIEEGAEFTVEANPGAASEGLFELWRRNGVNRLSIGVQSFSGHLLKIIGRSHTSAAARETFATARAAGFDNVSLDLMYGLPGQTMAGLKDDLRTLLDLRPEHISAYQLILEEGTPLEKMVCDGTAGLPDDDETYEMSEAITAALEEAGYRHYEISNYALPGRECRHNTAYWLGKPFLGLGSGAHSFINGKRLANPDEVEEYMHLIESKGYAFKEIFTDEKARIIDYLLMRLRLINNDVTFKELSNALNMNFKERFEKPLAKLREEKYITVTDSSLKLSKKGIHYLDNVLLEFSKV
ncbi:MAG: radical SAM family heme chaperone HemW [Nitrospinae bacterium]|nr:radical SAM family heme chaperone HemW [Nitrospinota bacterium]